MTDLLSLLSGVSRSGDGWIARCPAHDDHRNSLSVHHRDGRWLLKCHAGCEWRDIIDALGVEAQAFFDCQSASNFDPRSASKIDPLLLEGERGLARNCCLDEQARFLTLKRRQSRPKPRGGTIAWSSVRSTSQITCNASAVALSCRFSGRASSQAA